jgi:SHS2 domain-containing protein
MVEASENASGRRGCREVAHTADWALEVWAPEFGGLLREATRGMYALAGVELDEDAGEPETISLSGSDRVDLLVDWLSEVVFLWSARGQGVTGLEISIDGDLVEASYTVAPIVRQEKEVKAVTYHGLDVRETDRGLEATVTFDV